VTAAEQPRVASSPSTDPSLKRVRNLPVPPLKDLRLDEPDREKQASLVRQDAFRFARLFGRDILRAHRDGDKKGAKETVWSWGVCADKVLAGVDQQGLSIQIPQAMLDKFTIAVQLHSTPTPQQVDYPQAAGETVEIKPNEVNTL
jgi:hypothetical protein